MEELIETRKTNTTFLIESILKDESNYVMRLDILVNHYYEGLNNLGHKGMEKSKQNLNSINLKI